MGMCKMAPLEDGGVVDPILSAYEIKGLRIADLSISPSNAGFNTRSAAKATGEKAADTIAKKLGLTTSAVRSEPCRPWLGNGKIIT